MNRHELEKSESKKRKEMRRRQRNMANLKSGDRIDRADRRGSVGELLSRCGMFCFEDSQRKKRIGKKAKRWRGWGAYEGEDGIGARKKGWEGER